MRLLSNYCLLAPLKPTHAVSPGGIILLPNQHRAWCDSDDSGQYRVLAVGPGMWDEIRMRLQDEHEKEACALLIENDVYGYNFHKGIAAGCNKLDIAIRAALQAPNKPS